MFTQKLDGQCAPAHVSVRPQTEGKRRAHKADSPERGRLFQSPFLPVKCGSPSVPEWNDAWSTSTNSPLDKYRESRSLSPGITLTRANSRFEKNLELPSERWVACFLERP